METISATDYHDIVQVSESRLSFVAHADRIERIVR